MDGDLSATMDGVNAIFLLGDGIRLADHDRSVVSAAAPVDVSRLVKLSVLSVGHGTADPVTEWHRAGKGALRRSGHGWTFLRPTAFMLNALQWAHTIRRAGVGTAPIPSGPCGRRRSA
jgi:(4-alkanoyl-5-oxo-2,5-dihydrofuran-3-yl)methyl phosphate reductase